MRLKVSTPTQTVVDQTVTRIVAEAENGSFCLLPRHVDFVAALVPGVLTFSPAEGDGSRRFLAVDAGVLVKCGSDVLVSSRRAIAGDLSTLESTVAEEFRRLDARERAARTAVARLEAGALRRFAQLGEIERG